MHINILQKVLAAIWTNIKRAREKGESPMMLTVGVHKCIIAKKTVFAQIVTIILGMTRCIIKWQIGYSGESEEQHSYLP